MKNRTTKGNPGMKANGAKKLEVWLDPNDMDMLEKVSKELKRPKAKLARMILRYVCGNYGTGKEVLHAIRYDRGQV